MWLLVLDPSLILIEASNLVKILWSDIYFKIIKLPLLLDPPLILTSVSDFVKIL